MGNSKRRWLKPDIGRPSLQNPSSSIYDNLVIHRQVYDFMGRTWLRYIAKVDLNGKADSASVLRQNNHEHLPEKPIGETYIRVS